MPSIALLQVHPHRLTSDGVYDPAPLLASEQALLTPDGVLVGHDDGWVIDVHHASHPQRPRGSSGATISIGFTSHYEKMWSRFTERSLGVAGENVIIETDGPVVLGDLADGLVIATPRGDVILRGFRVAHPCVPFTRFLSERPDAEAADLQADLAFLQDGVRGFVTAMEDLQGPVEIRVGDEVRI